MSISQQNTEPAEKSKQTKTKENEKTFILPACGMYFNLLLGRQG